MAPRNGGMGELKLVISKLSVDANDDIVNLGIRQCIGGRNRGYSYPREFADNAGLADHVGAFAGGAALLEIERCGVGRSEDPVLGSRYAHAGELGLVVSPGAARVVSKVIDRFRCPR